MLVVYSPDHQLHQPQFELYDGQKMPYPEVPDRVQTIAAALQQLPDISWLQPKDDSDALSLHSSQYMAYLQQISGAAGMGDVYPSNFIHDTYAPITAGTFAAARVAAYTATTAANEVIGGQKTAYALCRPPGHHAGDGFMGGYCYFNNAAAAAQRLSTQGKVAILDIDFHHGNGTQALFYDRSDVMYVSVHADPATSYPYTHGHATETGTGQGVGLTRNIVVQKNCGWATYKQALMAALQTVTDFAPNYLVVSLGFDCRLWAKRSPLPCHCPPY
jgi:acetoin utilization deacetylase AcuC-like enzyme